MIVTLCSFECAKSDAAKHRDECEEAAKVKQSLQETVYEDMRPAAGIVPPHTFRLIPYSLELTVLVTTQSYVENLIASELYQNIAIAATQKQLSWQRLIVMLDFKDTRSLPRAKPQKSSIWGLDANGMSQCVREHPLRKNQILTNIAKIQGAPGELSLAWIVLISIGTFQYSMLFARVK